MARMIFINLPVRDLAASRHFYQALGFTINDAFSDDEGACVVISGAIYLMILTHGKYAQFANLPIGDARATSQHLLSLSCDTKAEVDGLVSRALAAGGTEPHPPEDIGFMYSGAFTDPDGNGWGPFWMDPAAAENGPPDNKG